jgi:hypothetical protein
MIKVSPQSPKRILRFLIVLSAFVLLFNSSVSVFALDEKFYTSNEIYFSDPNACSLSKNTSSTHTTVDITKNATLEQIFKLLVAGGMNAGQTSAIMGNMYAESGFNSDAHETGNDIGYGLVQWSFGRRTNLEKYATSKGVAASDIPTQITFLISEYNETYKSRLSSTAFKDGTDINAATEVWMNVFEAPALTPSNDPAALNSKRIPAASKIYDFYHDLAPAIAKKGQTSVCSTGNSIVAGNLVKTALNLALDKPAKSYNYPETNPTGPGTDGVDARDTYRAAKTVYNPSVAWSDCGGFIAVVMVSTGVDKNYPLVSVSKQADYVEAHPEKYTIIKKPAQSDLQPGDILISRSAGHTSMYTGEATYPDVDASLGQRVPSVRDSGSHLWMLANGAMVARVIK